MRTPLSWLRDFTPIPTDAPVDELVAALNQLGLEVEGVEVQGQGVEGVVAARVLGVAPHPNADRLTLVEVDTGAGASARVVCGATNVAAGDVVPYAAPGAAIPGLLLERRRIRGEESAGMLCSARELGLGDDHEGILHLDGNAAPGADVRAVLGLDDVVFDISVTPNRPDAMCVVGVARELAAHLHLPLDLGAPAGVAAPPDAGTASPAGAAPPDAGADDGLAGVTVAIEAPARCPRYVARVAAVEIGPSPAWLARRLRLAGMRPISNVVDVTNYILLERNQPLHAFDLDRLAGRGIVVRTAAAGERMTTLDGVERELHPDDLLICDAERAPQAIGGIMGGGSSEVSDATRSILLESAYFTPMGIARSSKRLKLRSEASARFERGTDPDAVAEHAGRAMALLAEVASGQVAPGVVDEYPAPVVRPRVTVRTNKVNRVLGTALADREVLDALAPLGIAVEGSGDDITAVPPSFRPDLTREIDMIEEVARRVGFASIARTVPRPRAQVGGLTARQRARRLVADALVGAGCSEAVTVPLVAPAELVAAGAPVDQMVEATNPLRVEESALRTRILPGLLRAVARNRARGLTDVTLFETGRVFLARSDDAAGGVGAGGVGGGVLPEEPWHCAVVLAGGWRRAPVEPDRPVDAHDAVDVLAALTDALELAGLVLAPGDRSGFAPGAASAVVVDGEDVGSVGEVAPAALAAFELDSPVVAFEVDLDRLLDGARRDRGFRAPSSFPPSRIDLAFVVRDEVPAGAVAARLREAAGELAEAVWCFDVFRSDALGERAKSVAFGLRFRAPDRTLTDAEVGEVRARCIDAVVGVFGAELRG